MDLPDHYKAYLVTKDNENHASASIVDRPFDDLPKGEVVIKVAYSSLNYKDALSATGNPGVTKNYPHVPGIDAAGVVIASESRQFQVNDKVLVTGYDLGSNTDGGYAEYIRVPADWIVPLPDKLSLKESMIYGTAGFTAAICIKQLQRNGVRPEQGAIVVSGATGGVGCMAVAILAKEGYTVVASTGKADAHEFLKELGATRIISREELNDQSNRPLLKSTYAGAVDTVGGNVLATIVKSIQVQGSVAACGVVAGSELDLTVFPFILRGVNLLGADSALWPMGPRREIWHKLATDWKFDKLASVAQMISLEQLDQHIAKILKGQITGRVIVTLE